MAVIIAKKKKLVRGNDIISGYQVSLAKLGTEKAGFKEGDSVQVIYNDNQIILNKQDINDSQ